MQTLSADPFIAFAHLHKDDVAPSWLCRAVTSGWGLDPERTEIRLIAVSENATFRIEIDAAPYGVLRVHRPNYVAPEQIVSELQWVQALAAQTRVQVPQVMACQDGSLVLSVNPSDDAATHWYAVAFAFVDGQVLEDTPDPRPYYRQIGEITALFHEHAQSWSPPTSFSRFNWELEDMLGPSSRWGDWRGARLTPQQRDLLEQAESTARDEIAPLHRDMQDRGLIHADLRPSNIMISGSELTVIDFDDCGHSWFLYDFAAAFSFIEHQEHTPELAKDWIRGYTGIRSLSDAQIKYACALSMIRRLQMLGWTTTHRKDALPAEVWAGQIPGSVSVANQYLHSRTWLLD